MEIEEIIRVLEDRYYLVPKKKKTWLSDQHLIESALYFICNKHNIDRSIVTGKSRKWTPLYCRYLVIYIVDSMMGWVDTNSTLIGRILNKDHATIIHGRKVIANLLDSDKKLRENFEENHAAFNEYYSKFMHNEI